ncbi:putative WRKY transcription factor 19 [Glycine soja]|uniref:Putative WRKY transcription factor 19 n=1 Tax=Glycine soja TaxID=3848 RepID=A0A445HPN0_GLYSO|nr:putative WRKY transcription factor 19 [Glycine soja]
MACNSIQSSSSLCTRNFDVFLSFRGTDTHNGFIDHLFASLPRKGVAAFRDDQTIKKGNSWSLGILQAIEGLRVYIVVFSKDYALSTWCMKELAKIVDWVEETGRKIEKIVEEVINILSHTQILSLGDDLVDMLSCVKQMEEFLDLDANKDIRVVGICEMGVDTFEEDVTELLAYCRFYPNIAMKVLIEKSLISCTETRMIQIHDLLKELDKSIVREKSPKESRKWSRIWDYKDFQNATIENMEAEILEAIVVKQYPKESMEKVLNVDAISKMNHHKLLILENVTFLGTLNYVSNKLRYLSWDRYPFKSLLLSFHLKQLVELFLPCSNIKQLWEATKCLPNLRTLDLRHSKNLSQMPNMRGVPHFEKLTFEGCIKIDQIDPSISILIEHTLLNLKNCKNLVLNLNIIFGLNSLQVLELSGCSKILNNQFDSLQPSSSLGKMDIIIPGTQIPKWFNKQNSSSSISMDPFPVMDDPNLIGVACCVLFVTHDDPSNLGDRWHPCDCPSFGYGVRNKQLECETYFTVPILFKKDLVTVEFHHLLVMFFTQDLFIPLVSECSNEMQDLDTMEFAPLIYPPPGLHLEVNN